MSKSWKSLKESARFDVAELVKSCGAQSFPLVESFEIHELPAHKLNGGYLGAVALGRDSGKSYAFPCSLCTIGWGRVSPFSKTVSLGVRERAVLFWLVDIIPVRDAFPCLEFVGSVEGEYKSFTLAEKAPGRWEIVG